MAYKDLEKAKATRRAWWAANRERARAYSRKSWAKNREKYLPGKRVAVRAYYQAHKDDPEFKRKAFERGRVYNALHRERRLEQGRRWRLANPQRHKELFAGYRAEDRAWLAAQKAKPCIDCGVQYPSYVMQFDHRPGTQKLFDISKSGPLSRKRGLAEIAKCDLVCANCHAQRTHERRRVSA